MNSVQLIVHQHRLNYFYPTLSGIIILFCFLPILLDSFYIIELEPVFSFALAMSGILFLSVVVSSLKIYRKDKDLLNPIVYAAWWYFIPRVALIPLFSIISAFHKTDNFVFLLGDERWLYVGWAIAGWIVGWFGILLGYHLNLGKSIGRHIAKFIKAKLTDWDRLNVPYLGISLYIVGYIFILILFERGAYGYQGYHVADILSGILSWPTFIFMSGHAIFWYGFFKAEPFKRRLLFLPAMVVIIGTIAYFPIGGSKGTLFMFGLYILIGYQYATRRIRKKALLILAVFMLLFLLIGMYFTPLYRTFKTATVGYIEGRVNLSENYKIFSDALFTTAPDEIIQETLYSLWSRIDAITPAAFLIARGEDMRILERAFGIENNIISTILDGFVPRFLWPAKPVISSRIFSEIYYNNPINQVEISYLVDLYRNFGVLGIFPGLFLVGIYLRIIYEAFIKARGPTSIGIFIYLPFLMLVNYEQLYADFIPMVWRTLLIVTVTLVIINWVIRILVKRI